MNLTISKTPRGRVATLIAITTISLLTACSPTPIESSATPPPSATPEIRTIDIRAKDAATGDELNNWTDRQAVYAGKDYTSLLQVPAVYQPSADIAKTGVFAVAPLGDYCIVALTAAGANKAADKASIAVLTRYNQIISSTMPDLSPAELAAETDHWREACTTGTYRLDETEVINGSKQTRV